MALSLGSIVADAVAPPEGAAEATREEVEEPGTANGIVEVVSSLLLVHFRTKGKIEPIELNVTDQVNSGFDFPTDSQERPWQSTTKFSELVSFLGCVCVCV